jgi:membrane protein implicated in regulation of membrane protease activity
METIFLACFVFGALFTLASIVLGVAGHGAAHVGHAQAHANIHIGHHVDVGLGHIGDSAVAGAHAGDMHGLRPEVPHVETSRFTLPLLNASSVIGALTWFGAAGYVLVRLGDWALPAVLVGALLAGAVGWYLVARFLGLVLAGEREMDPADYRLEGTIGTVTVGIPAGGTGEVMFSMAGARRSEAARAVHGTPIPRGSEVVITAYADGFAAVQPWGEFLAAHDQLAAPEEKEA